MPRCLFLGLALVLGLGALSVEGNGTSLFFKIIWTWFPEWSLQKRLLRFPR